MSRPCVVNASQSTQQHSITASLKTNSRHHFKIFVQIQPNPLDPVRSCRPWSRSQTSLNTPQVPHLVPQHSRCLAAAMQETSRHQLSHICLLKQSYWHDLRHRPFSFTLLDWLLAEREGCPYANRTYNLTLSHPTLLCWTGVTFGTQQYYYYFFKTSCQLGSRPCQGRCQHHGNR